MSAKREGFFDDILDKVKDLITEDDSKRAEDSGSRPGAGAGATPGDLIGHHDSEQDVPPPAIGTVA